MITVIPRKIAATLINGISPNNDGSITISAENITNGVFNYARIPIMQQATASQAGISGAVPAPLAGDQGKVLTGAGTWVAPSTFGFVAKAGDTMTGDLTIKSSHISFTNSNNQEMAFIVGRAESGKEGQFTVQEKVYGTSYYENYNFPIPDATSNQDYDVLTSKTPVTVPQGGTGATTPADALINLGAVAKAGDMMTGQLAVTQTSSDAGAGGLRIKVNGSNFPRISLFATNNNVIGEIVTAGTSSGNYNLGQMYFIEYNQGNTSDREYYYLPAPTVTNGGGKQEYNILTNKNVVTVGQGGTGATTEATARANLSVAARSSTSNKDANTVTEPGMHYLADTATNIPTGTNGFLYVAANSGQTAVKQIYSRMGTVGTDDHETYIRTINGSTVGSWYQIITEKGGTITGTLNAAALRTYASDYPMLAFTATASDTTAAGAVWENLSTRRLVLSQRSSSGYNEDYYLPANSATADATYDILTSKAPVAINQGGTGSTTKNFVDLTTNQTVAGIKTFTSGPLIDISATQLAADTTANILSFNYQNSNQKTKTVNVIRAYSDNEDGTNNGIALIGSHTGTTVITAGESAPTVIKNEAISNNENAYIITDGSIGFYVNAQTAANAFQALNITKGGYFVINSPSSGEFAGAIFSNIGSVNKYLTAYDISNKTWFTRIYNDAGSVSAEYRLPSATTVPSSNAVYYILTSKNLSNNNNVLRYDTSTNSIKSTPITAADAGQITIKATSQYSLYFEGHNASDKVTSKIVFDHGNSTNITKGQFTFYQYSPKSTADTSTTGKREAYSLPAAASGLTGDKTYNILTDKNAVTVAQGGTGATSFTANCAIISGSTTTGALTTRAITNNTSAGHANWTSSVGTNLITLNTLAYFNGRYNSSTSNLAYCNKGAFGDIVTHAASEFTTEVDFSSYVTNSASGAANIVSKFRKIGKVCMVTYQCTCTFSDTQWTLFTISNASYRPKAAFYTTGFCSTSTTVSGSPYAVVFQVNTDGTVKRIASQYTGGSHLVWCNFCYSVA